MRSRWAIPALLVPVLLTGCSAIPGWPGSAPGGADSTERPTGERPTGDSWVVVSQGSVAPSVTPTRRSTPTPSPSPSPRSGSAPPPAARPGATADPICAGSYRQGVLNGLNAVPGVGSMSVTWPNLGGPALVSYRLTAIPQDLVGGRQQPLTWQTITPGTSCGTMTATVTGLARGRPYVLSLDAVVKRTNADGDVGSTIARSGVVYPT